MNRIPDPDLVDLLSRGYSIDETANMVEQLIENRVSSIRNSLKVSSRINNRLGDQNKALVEALSGLLDVIDSSDEWGSYGDAEDKARAALEQHRKGESDGD